MNKWRGLFALILLLLQAPGLVSQQQPVRIHFIDVGDGDAVLIQSPSGQNVLYDGGGDPTRVRDQLISLGVSNVSLVIASHNHPDHIGGLPEVLRYFRPQFHMHNGIPAPTESYARMLDAAAEAGSQRLEPTSRRITMGAVSLVVLPPPGIDAWEQEDNSIGIIVEHGTFRLSLTGDAEQRQWAWWLTHHPDLIRNVHVHKAAHHGSIHGDTRNGIDSLAPEVVVVSVGERNIDRHPDPQTLRLYADQGATTYRTDRHGTVTIEAYGTGTYSVRLECSDARTRFAPAPCLTQDSSGLDPTPLALAPPVSGLLGVHPTNPIYLTDGFGRAIYLGGHQIFVDLQDNTFDKPFTYNQASTLDWSWYMHSFLNVRKLNYVRNWSEHTTGSARGGPVTNPMPYQRVSGNGDASDGMPKFDLNRFDEDYFGRLRERAVDLQNSGAYLSITLFDYHAFTVDGSFGWSGWRGNVFNSNNNINGVHADLNGDGQGTEFFSSPTEQIKALQQAYVRKIINTVGDLDNVFFETGNEVRAVNWHYDLIDFIKRHEAARHKQHLILFSPAIVSTQNQVIFSAADMFAVDGVNWGIDYTNNPPPNTHGKPGIMDWDHIAPPGNPGPVTPWKALTRGYHFTLYDTPFETPVSESLAWDLTRKNLGAVVEYTRRFKNLAGMRPNPSASSTAYALVDAGSEYLVLQAGSGDFTVNVPAGTYSYEWFNPATATLASSGSVRVDSGNPSFSPPFSGSAVLYLRRRG